MILSPFYSIERTTVRNASETITNELFNEMMSEPIVKNVMDNSVSEPPIPPLILDMQRKISTVIFHNR